MLLRDKLKFWMALSNYVDMIVRGTSPLSLPDAIADSLSYVKAFGGTEQRNLPDGYIERQFIYMMDGSYLLTDIVPTYDCKIEIDFGTTTVMASKTVLGGRAAVYGGMELIIAGSKNFVVDAFGTDSADRYSSSVTAQNNTRYKFTYANQVATLESGGSTLFTNTMTGTAANSAILCINGNNDNGRVGGVGEIYLYSFKVWNGQGELVMDLVPAVQKGTVPVVGFYDTVSKTFKTATSGTFAAGGEAVPTPDAPMDIVSNNGVVKVSPNLFDKSTAVNAQGSIFPDGYISYNTGAGTFEMKVSPNTQYTLSISPSLSTTIFRIVSLSSKWDRNTAVNGTLIAYERTVTQFTFTTDSNAQYIYFQTNSAKWEDVKETLQLELGSTATPYHPYGIYTDGTVETINVHGKNLLDADVNSTAITATPTTPIEIDFDLWYKSIAYNGYATTNDISNFSSGIGTVTFTGRNSSYGCARFVKLRPNTTYTISCSNPTSNHKCAISCYVDNGDGTYTPTTHIKTSNRLPLAFTTNSNVVYGIIFYSPGNASITYSGIQLEQGSTATTYEPYFNGVSATAEMLLKIGDYQDVQSIIDGVVTRNVGVKVFDGTENWVFSTTWLNYMYSLEVSDLYAEASSVVTNRKSPYCTHFNRSENWLGGSARANMVQAYQPTTGDAILGLGYGTPSAANLATFKQWLADQYAAGTPVTVIYPLAQAVTEQVAPQVLNVQAGDNILEITQASLSNLELEAKYHKKHK